MRTVKSAVCLAFLLIVAGGLVSACSDTQDSDSDEWGTTQTEALRDAASVLAFDDPSAWITTDAQPQGNERRVEGKGALSLRRQRTNVVTSAPFKYKKTPNVVEFALSASSPEDLNVSLRQTRASLSCKERNIGPYSLFNPDVAPTEQQGFYRVRFAVPATLQEELVGGCENFVVSVQLNSNNESGDYVMDAMNLRARTPGLSSRETPQCAPLDTTRLLASAKETPEGHWDFQSWLASPIVQAELPGLQSILERHHDSVLGVMADHDSKQVVVVVDKDAFASRRVHSALASADIALPLRLQPSCNSVKALRLVQAEFERREWPEGTPAFAAHPDTVTGQYVVTLDPGTEESEEELDALERQERGERVDRSSLYHPTAARLRHAQSLQGEFGTLVRVGWGRAGRRDRANDSQRHYGGAAIGSNNVNFCTSGFIVNHNGFMGSVTAGHCFKTDGITVTSGIYAYGVSAGIAPFPDYDMTRIDPGLQTYTTSIHTGPSAPVTRVQVGEADPVYLNLVCVSGMVTGAKCGIEVLDNNCSVYNPGMGTTSGLTRGVRAGVLIGQSGDSGAPVYTRSGAVGAIINGMESGGAVEDEICFHKVSTIESRLGVTVAL